MGHLTRPGLLIAAVSDMALPTPPSLTKCLCALATVIAMPFFAHAEYLKAKDFKSQLRFGAEMTVSSQALLDSYPSEGAPVRVSPLGADIVSRMHDRATLKYVSGKKATTLWMPETYPQRPNYTVRYKDGFKMNIFTDPGALEMNASPMSLVDLKKNSARIQTDYLEAAKLEGLAPALFTGSGHMHIEVSKVHPVTFRNFLADFYNATSLAAGALNDDIFNSIGVGEIPESNKETLRAVFKDFDSDSSATIMTLANGVKYRVYSIPLDQEPAAYRESRGARRPKKYFAASFESIDRIGTLEIRSIRPQASAKSFQKLANLWVKRMELAEKNRLRGKLTPIGELKSVRNDPQAVLKDFDRYLSEVGLKLEDYREFVLPWWQNAGGEVDRYLINKRAPRVINACESLF